MEAFEISYLDIFEYVGDKKRCLKEGDAILAVDLGQVEVCPLLAVVGDLTCTSPAREEERPNALVDMLAFVGACGCGGRLLCLMADFLLVAVSAGAAAAATSSALVLLAGPSSRRLQPRWAGYRFIRLLSWARLGPHSLQKLPLSSAVQLPT